MNVHDKHSLEAFGQGKQRAKDTDFQAHGAKIQAVYQSFFYGAKTMLEVERRTGVKRTTICGYVAQFRKKGLITELYKAPCKISGNKAKYFKIL